MTLEDKVRYLESSRALRDAREYLAQYGRLDARIGLKLARLDVMREKQRRLRGALGQALEGAPALPGIREAEEEVLADYSALLKLQKDIGDHIRRVPGSVQQAVLEMHYLQGMPFFRAAMALHYEERQIYRLHRAGLKAIAAQLLLEGALPGPAGATEGENGK